MKTRESNGAYWSFSAGEYGTTVRLREHRGWIHGLVRGRWRSLRHKDRSRGRAWAEKMSEQLASTSGVEGVSRFLKFRSGLVYLVGDAARGLVKIGWTTHLEARMETLAVGNPGAELLTWFPGSRCVERELHQRFAALRVAGEWFKLEGALLRFLEYVGSGVVLGSFAADSTSPGTPNGSPAIVGSATARRL